jgi:hypothetical protein
MKASLKLVATVALVLLWAGLGTAQDQKPSGQPQPQQQEPATSPPPQTDQPKTTQPENVPSTQPEPCATCAPAVPRKPAPIRRKSRKKGVRVKAGASQSSESGTLGENRTGASTGTSPVTSAALPGKIVIRNGGAKDDTPQLTPGGGREQESHSRESTVQLLATTDANVKKLASRHLTPAQQVTLEQIRSYVAQAKLASDAEDMIRARTLAYKARLLSDDLSKP